MSPIVLAIIPVLFFLAVVVLGGLAILLINPQTRLAGLGMLTILVVMLSVGAFTAFAPHKVQVDASSAGGAQAETSQPAGTKPAASPAEKKTFASLLVSHLKRSSKPAAGPAAKQPAAKNDSAPKARPAWVDALPRKIDDVYQISVMVTPFATQLERDTADVPKALQNAFSQYVRLQLGAEAAGQVQLPPEELLECIKDEWAMTVDHSGHPMTHLYLLLEFNSKMKDRVLEEWKQVREEKRQALVARRLWRTGIGVAAGLLLVATLFMALRIDQVTAGAKRGRLGFLAVVVGLAVVAGTYFSLRLIEPPAHATDADGEQATTPDQ